MIDAGIKELVSTHSRPKAAALPNDVPDSEVPVSTHSRPKAADFGAYVRQLEIKLFQHTAARRRLRTQFDTQFEIWDAVSTHSRPKAAELTR